MLIRLYHPCDQTAVVLIRCLYHSLFAVSSCFKTVQCQNWTDSFKRHASRALAVQGYFCIPRRRRTCGGPACHGSIRGPTCLGALCTDLNHLFIGSGCCRPERLFAHEERIFFVIPDPRTVTREHECRRPTTQIGNEQTCGMRDSRSDRSWSNGHDRVQAPPCMRRTTCPRELETLATVENRQAFEVAAQTCSRLPRPCRAAPCRRPTRRSSRQVASTPPLLPS